MAALLDTSILIASGAAGRELPESAAISVISIGELRAGVVLADARATRDARQARLDAVRRAFLPLPVGEDVAERYGDVLAVARQERRAAKATDLLIVATAIAHDRALYTLDVQQARLASACGASVVAA